MARHYGHQDDSLASYLIVLGITVAAIFGWVMNIISLWHTMDGPLTAKFIVRVIGVFVPVIGAVLGYL